MLNNREYYGVNRAKGVVKNLDVGGLCTADKEVHRPTYMPGCTVASRVFKYVVFVKNLEDYSIRACVGSGIYAALGEADYILVKRIDAYSVLGAVILKYAGIGPEIILIQYSGVDYPIDKVVSDYLVVIAVKESKVNRVSACIGFGQIAACGNDALVRHLNTTDGYTVSAVGELCAKSVPEITDGNLSL